MVGVELKTGGEIPQRIVDAQTALYERITGLKVTVLRVPRYQEAQVLRFTPKEREAVLHRLAVPDCLADALSEEWPRDLVEITADALHTRLERSGFLITPFNPLEKAVLQDAIEGSTWVRSVDEETEGRAAATRAYNQLVGAAEKLRAAGVEITEIPHG